MKKAVTVLIVVGVLGFMLPCTGFGSSGGSQSSDAPDGVICLTPVLESSCIAVRLPMNSLQAVAGIRWFNNDASVVFPNVMVASGYTETPPLVDQATVMAEEVQGETSAWSQVQFAGAVASATEALYVLFQLPAHVERAGEGLGGGPGIGYKADSFGPSVFFSSDGEDWVRLNYDCKLLVEPILVERQGGMLVLSAPRASADMAGDVPMSWETDLGVPYPNPFNPMTNIQFTLKEEGEVDISVYNVRGQLVNRLFRGFAKSGPHVVKWMGSDSKGAPVASGVYFARMRAGGFTETQRVLLLK